MNCTICLNKSSNVLGIRNDCVIECLENIKTHYMNLKKQLSEKELVISTLKETNSKLEKTIKGCKLIEMNCSKKRRTNCTQDNGSEVAGSEMFENAVVDKTLDDFNMAKNDEKEFEISFINNSFVSHEDPIAAKREPMKSIGLTLNNDVPKTMSISSNKKSVRCKKENKVDLSMGNVEHTKNSSWISKENEIKRSIGSLHKHFNRSHGHIKRDIKPPNLSLKSTKLRQTRLQLDISRSKSNAGDSTFCEEAIEASPNSDSTLKKSNSSRQWLLRNISNKIDKPDNDSIFEITKPCPKTLTTNKLKSPNAKDEGLDTSSVVMLTPATQDIIFLDDSCESFNIESMDLLRDLMNPSETHLTNLRRMESNRIKLLQKAVGEKTEYHTNKCSDVGKLNLERTFTTDNDHAQSGNVEENRLNLECLKDTFTGENKILKPNKEFKVPPINAPKDEDYEFAKRERLFQVDCIECQTYIKYLGTRLTDEQVEQHLRSCSKHKKTAAVNLTPDGFWDPLIKPLNKNDPRNETLIDDRFISKVMHK